MWENIQGFYLLKALTQAQNPFSDLHVSVRYTQSTVTLTPLQSEFLFCFLNELS